MNENSIPFYSTFYSSTVHFQFRETNADGLQIYVDVLHLIQTYVLLKINKCWYVIWHMA